MDAFRARTDRFEVVYASKAFPCTAAYRLFAEEGLSCDVASGGELYLALRGGFAPERIYFHGNNKSEAEIVYAHEQGVGHIVADSFDEIDRLERIAPGQRVLLRVTPGIKPETHALHLDRAGGLQVRLRRRRRAARDRPHRHGSSCAGCTPTSARRSSTSAPYEKLAEVLTAASATTRCSTSAVASASPTPTTSGRRAVEDYVDTLLARRCRTGSPCCASRAARSSATPA